MAPLTRKLVLMFTGFAMVVVLLLLPNAFGEEKKKLDGKTLFQTKCLKCHKPAKFKEQASDRKGWVLTLSRMQRSTCQISDDELEVLADYLAKEYGD